MLALSVVDDALVLGDEAGLEDRVSGFVVCFFSSPKANRWVGRLGRTPWRFFMSSTSWTATALVPRARRTTERMAVVNCMFATASVDDLGGAVVGRCLMIGDDDVSRRLAGWSVSPWVLLFPLLDEALCRACPLPTV